MSPATAAFLATLALVAAAHASPVRFIALGHVENNAFNSGTFAGIPGLPTITPVRLQINLDSDVYLDSPNLPGRTRGYSFGAADLTFDVGAVHAIPRADQALNYFVIRNDDPGVDGVFISRGTDIDVEIPLAMTPNNYGVAFLRTFDSATVFPSLDILQCTGNWTYEFMSSYNWAVQRGEGNTPLIVWYDSFSITRQCGKGDVGQAGGLPDFDGQLDNNDFIAFINFFFDENSIADMGIAGGLPGSDGQFDNNDFIAFINEFFNGCD